VFELSVFIYYIYLMLFADSLSVTVLSPAEITIGGPVPLVG
jgi:ABC-type Fe3+-siderophore transport system permease subunit